MGYWQIKKWKESCTNVYTKFVPKAKYQKVEERSIILHTLKTVSCQFDVV